MTPKLARVSFQPGHLTGLASIDLNGGTGRFAHATGHLKAVADVTMGPFTYEAFWPVSWLFEGILGY